MALRCADQGLAELEKRVDSLLMVVMMETMVMRMASKTLLVRKLLQNVQDVGALFFPFATNAIPGTGPGELRYVGIDNNESRATNNLYRKELTALRRDLAATPNKHLVCRAPICLLKDSPHPRFPALLLTTTELTRDIPHLVVSCTNQCRIGYHHQCWKKMTSEMKKKNKEMCKPSAKKTCPTDDCGGVVIHEQHM